MANNQNEISDLPQKDSTNDQTRTTDSFADFRMPNTDEWKQSISDMQSGQSTATLHAVQFFDSSANDEGNNGLDQDDARVENKSGLADQQQQQADRSGPKGDQPKDGQKQEPKKDGPENEGPESESQSRGAAKAPGLDNDVSRLDDPGAGFGYMVEANRNMNGPNTPSNMTYSRADSAEKSLNTADREAIDKLKEINKESKDNSHAEKLIEGLKSDKFKDRKEAADKLINLGPAAEDAVKKLVGGPDVDLDRQAKEILKEIEQRKIAPKLDKYSETVKEAKETFDKAGLSVETFLGDVKQRFEPKQEKGPIDPELKKSFESVIKNADAIKNDPDYEKNIEKFRGDSETYDMMQMYKTIAPESRILYAGLLAQSSDPKDHEQAINVLTEHIEKSDDKAKAASNTQELAKTLQAEKNENYAKAFKDSGAENKVNVNQLLQRLGAEPFARDGVFGQPKKAKVDGGEILGGGGGGGGGPAPGGNRGDGGDRPRPPAPPAPASAPEDERRLR
jgi:hypothetical protein